MNYDAKGGNIGLFSPNKTKRYEMDCYNSNNFRLVEFTGSDVTGAIYFPNNASGTVILSNQIKQMFTTTAHNVTGSIAANATITLSATITIPNGYSFLAILGCSAVNNGNIVPLSFSSTISGSNITFKATCRNLSSNVLSNAVIAIRVLWVKNG